MLVWCIRFLLVPADNSSRLGLLLVCRMDLYRVWYIQLILVCEIWKAQVYAQKAVACCILNGYVRSKFLVSVPW